LPLGSKGTVQIRLNGIQVALLNATSKDGEKAEHAAIQIPVSLLYPRNTLDIEFRHQAARSGGRQPVGQVLGTSALDLSEIPNFTQLPRLDLFANAGFPFTRSADLQQTAVLLPTAATPEQVSLYLDLLGFFGAQTGYPSVQVKVVDANQATQTDRDLLIIGSMKDNALPQGWQSYSPLKESSGGFVLNSAEGLLGRLDTLSWTRSGRERSRLNDALASDPPEVVLEGFASPSGNGRSVVSISANSIRGSEEFIDALATAAGQAEITGSVSLYQGGKFRSFRIGGGDYYLGSLGHREMFNYQVAKRFTVLPFLIVSLAIVLGYLAHRWLERHAALRVKA
jgi:cellulose synthase (UDP-forming)